MMLREDGTRFEFFAEQAAQSRWAERLAQLDPCNPFCTMPYFAFMRDSGYEAWVFGLRQGAAIAGGCGAFVRSGKLSRTLEILSAPALPDMAAFWDGLLAFCRQNRTTHLEVNSFASTNITLPALGEEQGRVRRWECVMDLAGVDLWERLHAKHRQRIRKAQRAGVQIRCTSDESACEQHEALLRSSGDRRRSRGEKVADPAQTQSSKLLIRHGAGQLFQAVLDGGVLSSVLVTMAARGGYSNTAGTSPQGMSCGASHLLNYEIARALQSRSMEVYNLGGVRDLDSGLAEFKLRFGARLVELEAADFFLGGRLRKSLTTAVRLARDIRGLRLDAAAKPNSRQVAQDDSPGENRSAVEREKVPGAPWRIVANSLAMGSALARVPRLNSPAVRALVSAKS
jgi:lipid II:glycine glycyltransferase (peptidoglycan interpeptide bridge formation enzyme)